MFKRSVCHTLLKRVQEPRRFIQVLAGPRQTGKTTIAKSGRTRHRLSGMAALTKAFKVKRQLLIGQEGIAPGEISNKTRRALVYLLIRA